MPLVGRDLHPTLGGGDEFGVRLRRGLVEAELSQLVGRSRIAESARLGGQRFDLSWGRRPEDDVDHRCQSDLLRDALQHQHLTVAGRDNVPRSLAAHDETHHLAANVAAPPSALECAVGTAERVDHRRDLGMGLAEHGQHTLRDEVSGHLIPHHVSQVELRNVGPDSQRWRELHDVEFVGDDEHAIDGDLDADDVIDVWGVLSGAPRRGHRVCIRSPRRPPASPSTLSYAPADASSLSAISSATPFIPEPAARRAFCTASTAAAVDHEITPWVTRTEVSTPSATSTADRISVAACRCLAASSRSWAVATRKSPDM